MEEKLSSARKWAEVTAAAPKLQRRLSGKPLARLGAAAALTLCLALSACGGKPAVDQVTGTWYSADGEVPAFTLDPTAPAAVPRAVQAGGQLTLPAPGGGTRTADILSRENGRLTLGFAGAGMLVFWDSPEQADAVSGGGDSAG